MEQAIGQEAAELELERIIDFWEVDPEGEDWENSKRRLLSAIGKGRVSLDEEKEAVTMKLVKPIEQENGKTISEFVFSEPNAGDLRVFDKYKEQEKMAKTLHLASKMTGYPLGIVERMASRDIATMGAIASLFF